MDRVKYAIIGFGGIAENRIAKEGFCIDRSRFEEHPNAVLAGVTDLNKERKQAAESLGLKWYNSTEEILSDNSIEAVYIATNNKSHAQLAVQAIQAGKHCIIEKPMATKIEDAERIQNAAAEYSRSVCVDHMMKLNTFNRLARDRIKNETIGSINDITLHMEFSFGSLAGEAETWRCSDPSELGGPIGDVASHCLYMAEFLLGEKIASLQCIYLPESINIDVENGAFVQLKFESGRTGSIRVSFSQPRGGLLGTLSNLGYEIYGSEGVLRGYGLLFQISGHDDEPVKLRLIEETSNGFEELYPEKIQNIYQSLIKEHAVSIRNGSRQTGGEGIRNLSQIIACHNSAQEGGKVIEL